MGTGASVSEDRPEHQPSSNSQEQQHSVNGESYLESDNASDEERPEASIVSTELSTTLNKEERILRARFKILNDGSKEQTLNRDVFEKDPYSVDRFSQRLVSFMFQSAKDNGRGQQSSRTVNFKDFCEEMAKWQDANKQDKLEMLFSLMKVGPRPGSITHNVLWKVLVHSLPHYSEAECQLLAKGMIDIMTDSANDISLSQYKNWITENVPEDQLEEALEFKISNL